MTNKDLFLIAARRKFRFPSSKGDLTVEQLFDLPLTTSVSTRVDLDSVARAVNAELRSVTDESFVVTAPNPRKGELEQKLEIVKAIIAIKMAENAAAAAASEKANKRRILLKALANATARELASKSKDDLLKELEALR